MARAYGLESAEAGFWDGAFLVDKERRIRLAKTANEPVGEVTELLAAGQAATRPR